MYIRGSWESPSAEESGIPQIQGGSTSVCAGRRLTGRRSTRKQSGGKRISRATMKSCGLAFVSWKAVCTAVEASVGLAKSPSGRPVWGVRTWAKQPGGAGSPRGSGICPKGRKGSCGRRLDRFPGTVGPGELSLAPGDPTPALPPADCRGLAGHRDGALPRPFDIPRQAGHFGVGEGDLGQVSLFASQSPTAAGGRPRGEISPGRSREDSDNCCRCWRPGGHPQQTTEQDR